MQNQKYQNFNFLIFSKCSSTIKLKSALYIAILNKHYAIEK